MKEYELYHHGIKGQKWGIRRTAAQLGHRVAKTAQKAGGAIEKSVVKAKKSASVATKRHVNETKQKLYYRKLHKKKISQMTDKEITDLTKRVKLEANLKNARYESRIQNARKFYNTVAKQPVNTFAATWSREAIAKAFKSN